MDKTNLNIILVGWRGSGKDTFADYLVKHYNYKRYAFADAVKEYSANLYDIPRHLFDDPLKKNQKYAFNKSPRDICIHVGEMAKKINENIWVDKVFHSINGSSSSSSSGGGNVISDCRFPVELNRMKMLENSVSVWINRFEEIPDECINEPTENSLSQSDCDLTVVNKGTMYDFYCNIEYFLDNFN